jgi:hypothetical protein
MSAPATSFPRLDRSSSCEEVQSTLGEIVMAVMQFAAHSREAAEVIDDLFETGRIRATSRWAADATTDDDLFDFLKGMNPDGDKDPIDGVSKTAC